MRGPAARSGARGRRVLRSVGSNWARMAVSILAAFVLTPRLIQGLSVAGNDVWVQINTYLMFLGLLALGVPLTSVKHFAEHVARNDVDGLNRTIATTMGLYLRLGLAAGGLGLLFFALFVQLFSAAPEWAESGRIAFLLMVVQIAASFVLQVPYGVMVARGEFGVSNLLMIGGMLFRLGLILAVLAWRPSLVLIALAHLAQTAVEGTIAFSVARRRYPGVRFGFGGGDRALARSMIAFSLFVLLLQVGNRLAAQIGTAVVGHALPGEGPSSVFSNGNQFLLYLTELLIGIGQVVMPLAVKLRTKGRHEELAGVLLRWSRAAFSVALLGCLYLLALGPEFIRWWIPTPTFDHRAAGEVLQILCLGFLLFLPVRGVALPVLMGLGLVKLPSIALLATGLLVFLLSALLVGPLGLQGVALATGMPLVLFAALVARSACRAVSLPFGRYAVYVFGRPLLGALPVAALLAALKFEVGVSGFWPLLGAGLAAALLMGVVWVLFVQRNDPHFDPWRTHVAPRLFRPKGRS
jgi:O-antigen/teichoic acid export membrane protein